MSNKVVNALIALVEGRTQHAREMLRSPELNISASDVQIRLALALQTRENAAKIEALKDVLVHSLRIDGDLPRLKQEWTEAQREAYLMGVAKVEGIIDELIEHLEPSVLARRNTAR